MSAQLQPGAPCSARMLISRGAWGPQGSWLPGCPLPSPDRGAGAAKACSVVSELPVALDCPSLVSKVADSA